MRSKLVVLTGAALLTSVVGLATEARAQYRSGMPPVTAPRAQPETGAAASQILAEFTRWNIARQRPTILILWDRTFSDEATTRTRARLSEDVVVASQPGIVVAQRDVVIGDERVADDHSSALNTRYSAQLEDAYMQTLLDAGAAVVDRNALMRRASIGVDRTDRQDQQFLETLAVEQGVRYLIEVLPQSDAASPTGLSTTIKITDLPTARVAARFVTNAGPPAERRRLVAGPGGFRREAAAVPDARDIGSQLGLETLRALR